MKMKEMENATNLTAKAIRFYESKGLISAKRQENAYRDYDEETLRQLKEIRLYRKLGIRVSDLKLVKDGVISAAEVFQNRLSELKREEESMKVQYQILRRIQERVCIKREALNSDEFLPLFDDSAPEDESAESLRFQEGISSSRLAVGIDIGTTTLSATVVNGDNGHVVDVYSIDNNTFLKTGHEWEYVQDTSLVLKRAMNLLDSILSSYANVKAIGVTGQMHGIVYLNSAGEALSPLITWQDRRCDLPFQHTTYSGYISELTQCQLSTGYGLATHFYQLQNGLVPHGASTFCTIMDYLVMKLTGRKLPLVHASNGASFGCFDLPTLDFYRDRLERLSIDTSILPPVTGECDIAGEYRGIPVSVAIGDNQASFLGSVSRPNESILVNIGTGSQISVKTSKIAASGLDVRPYTSGQYLLVGSSLCGGRAYAMLERLFRSIAIGAGAPDKPLYGFMNTLAEAALDTRRAVSYLVVSTLFSGTRADPGARGSIQNIDTENLTPEQLVLGTLRGITSELFELYKQMEPTLGGKPRYLVASGNAVRKNKALQRLLGETFAMEVQVPENAEEAAFGAALFALMSCGLTGEGPTANPFINNVC